MVVLPIIFLVIAVLYASVGLGGGSSYVAFLALFDAPYEDIPQVALVCNIIVVTGGTCHFARQGHFKWRLFWPFVVGALPCAYIGGRIPIEAERFFLLLGISLALAGVRMLFVQDRGDVPAPPRTPSRGVAVVIGSALGLLSGLVGIGGGIFLAPVMMNLNWGRPKQVAATASTFILINSFSGLAGHLAKHQGASQVLAYWPLFLVVLVGGQVGSRLGSTRLSQQMVRRLTAVLVLLVGARVLLKALL